MTSGRYYPARYTHQARVYYESLYLLEVAHCVLNSHGLDGVLALECRTVSVALPTRRRTAIHLRLLARGRFSLEPNR